MFFTIFKSKEPKNTENAIILKGSVDILVATYELLTLLFNEFEN